ncbi:hypothetical protein DBV15_00545 [Temnothorax longispinosus]|uniref:Uncharacterized protein n=1 Tax=Temnothorax longispinosus TaxID=300112 RepID=A0A4S2KSN7_9HYME|nr:hypothetical protein DBV15_00545 [Temnothorax longispinosus]
MSAALSNRRELERYFELVNTTDDDRVENERPSIDRPVRSIGRDRTENIKTAKSISDPASGLVGNLRNTDSDEEGNDKAARSACAPPSNSSGPGASASLLSAGSSSWSQVGQCERGFKTSKRKTRTATWKRRGKGSRREVREEEPCSERGRWKDGERTRTKEMRRLMLVEGGRGGGECVRMLSADSSRPEDHTARPPCVPSALFANISAIKHWAETTYL